MLLLKMRKLQFDIKNEGAGRAILPVRKMELNTVNNFVIFCNFPLDETNGTRYNDFVKNGIEAETSAIVPDSRWAASFVK